MANNICSVCGQVMKEEEKYSDNMCWECKFGMADDYINNENRDWTSNKKSTFVTLGASNHTDHEREPSDYYSTDPKALRVFLEKLKKDGIELTHNIWECACGNGALSEVLIENEYDVFSTDLKNRGFGIPDADFFEFKNLPFEKYDKDIKWTILTNPPYKYAKEFVEHALEITRKGELVIMFLKIQFLEGQDRKKLFEKYPPKYVYVNSARQICYLNGDMSRKMSSATCYCWYVWENGFNGEPTIRWI